MRVIGHGIDLVEIARVGRMLEEHGGQFIDRCFTAGESQYAESGDQRRLERYAARLACKEAVMKAIGTGWRDGISWRDIEVRKDPMGRPTVVLSGRCLDIAREQGIARWHVSLSHTDSHAIASVIACGE